MKTEKKLNVLLVDDRVEDFRMMSMMVLYEATEDYEFQWARNGEEAMKALDEKEPDIVCIDYNLGSECGIDTMRRLRQTHPNLPYILISGSQDPELFKEGLEAGADSFILKNHNSGALFDRTALYAIEHMRKERKLKKSNESKNRLMSLLAHDLGNPLCSLIHTLDNLKMSLGSEDKDILKRRIDLARASAMEVLETTREVLDWGRSQKGGLEAKIQPTCIAECVSRAFKLLASQAAAKDIVLTFNGNLNTHALADKEMLLAVLRNLTANAIKFSHPLNEVLVQISGDRDYITVEVNDSGIGMGPAKLEEARNISSEFPSRDSDNLGLQTCTYLLKLMGSKLCIESSEGVGSTFSFTLPKKPRSAQPEEASTKRNRIASASYDLKTHGRN